MSDPNDVTGADSGGPNTDLASILSVQSIQVAQNGDGSITVTTGIGTGLHVANAGANPQSFSINAADLAAASGSDNGMATLILTRYNNTIGL